ncbi:MAG: hypothetical protein J6R75_04215 [Candidatus Methanomethylophilaceae archaeon]|nr:hypothetical protein [Candidatus Methanomethylophilaceae archaeon]
MGYDDTVMEASKDNRGIFERICLWIPGYRGYRQKNIRRDVDKEIRSEVARSIEECKSFLAEIQRGVVENGDIQMAKTVERVRVKTDTYLKNIESAEAGYSGIWEATKTLEDELEAVMEWDAKLLESAYDLKKLLKMTWSKVDGGSVDIKSDIREIERFLLDLDEGLGTRMKVIRGLAEPETETEGTINKLKNRLR